MDINLFNRWIAALRSGEFSQGKADLRRKERYCCLGVLRYIVDPSNNDSRFMLTTVQEQEFGLSHACANTLANLNDGGASFEAIAAWLTLRGAERLAE